VWKNPKNDRSRESPFYAPNLICAGDRHDKAHGRTTRGKIARAAEPLPNFPLKSSIAVQIVIDAKNRVFPPQSTFGGHVQMAQQMACCGRVNRGC
jgi:hypothetical protein